MAVIGADNQVVGAGCLHHIGQIVSHLAGHIEVILTQNIVGQFLASAIKTLAEILQDIG